MELAYRARPPTQQNLNFGRTQVNLAMYTWLENTAPRVPYALLPSEIVLAGWKEVTDWLKYPFAQSYSSSGQAPAAIAWKG